jgi:hypothetical protein
MGRQERETAELKQLIGQMRTAQREFTEGQLLETEQLKRQMADWIEVLEVRAKKMDEHTTQIQEFAEAFRLDRQVVASVERFQEQIRREQTQVAELQRLAEERQKRQLEQWQEENEKRWKKELLHWEYQWGEQGKRNKQLGDELVVVGGHLTRHRTELDGVWKFLEAQITYQTQEARRWLGEMNRLLEERPKKE